MTDTEKLKHVMYGQTRVPNPIQDKLKANIELICTFVIEYAGPEIYNLTPSGSKVQCSRTNIGLLPNQLANHATPRSIIFFCKKMKPS